MYLQATFYENQNDRQILIVFFYNPVVWLESFIQYVYKRSWLTFRHKILTTSGRLNANSLVQSLGSRRQYD